MSERKNYDKKLQKVGNLFAEKRRVITHSSREYFIMERSETIFNYEHWISERHLASIEEGKTLPSIEMLIKLSHAFETDAVDLFAEVLELLQE